LEYQNSLKANLAEQTFVALRRIDDEKVRAAGTAAIKSGDIDTMGKIIASAPSEHDQQKQAANLEIRKQAMIKTMELTGVTKSELDTAISAVTNLDNDISSVVSAVATASGISADNEREIEERLTLIKELYGSFGTPGATLQILKIPGVSEHLGEEVSDTLWTYSATSENFKNKIAAARTSDEMENFIRDKYGGEVPEGMLKEGLSAQPIPTERPKVSSVNTKNPTDADVVKAGLEVVSEGQDIIERAITVSAMSTSNLAPEVRNNIYAALEGDDPTLVDSIDPVAAIAAMTELNSGKRMSPEKQRQTMAALTIRPNQLNEAVANLSPNELEKFGSYIAETAPTFDSREEALDALGQYKVFTFQGADGLEISTTGNNIKEPLRDIVPNVSGPQSKQIEELLRDILPNVSGPHRKQIEEILRQQIADTRGSPITERRIKEILRDIVPLDSISGPQSKQIEEILRQQIAAETE